MSRSRTNSSRVAVLGILLLGIALPEWAQSIPGLPGGTSANAQAAPVVDSLKRTTPRSSIYTFLQACHTGQYDLASDYLDLRRIRSDQRNTQGPELAKDLCQVLDRDTHFEVGRLSNDPDGATRDHLANNVDELTSVEVNAKTVQLTMQRITQNGLSVWLVSPDTVAQIPKLRASVDESEFEKKLPATLVETRFIGTSLWV